MADRNARAKAREPRRDTTTYLEGVGTHGSELHYSDEAHQVWREVLAKNRAVVFEHADRIHPAYLEGLRELALPHHVPRAAELNERLRSTGWKVVPVHGYIPAAAYAALMAENVFPVSVRIRRLEHLEFAPEPDLVHDVLGHLPMLFCAEHRDYLREIARVAVRATPNTLDSAFHEAVRRSAELKSRPGSSASEIEEADARLAEIYAEMREDASEVTCLRRLYTWSVEFGLFGSTEDLVIHGAALLSAPAELRRVATGGATLAPFSLDVIHHENAFSDLLERYFVAKGYAELHDALGTFAASMRSPMTTDVHELRSGAFEVARRNDA